MNERAVILTPRGSQWRWPREPTPEMQAAIAARLTPGAHGLPGGVRGNDALRRAVIESPDDDSPRHAYAAWMAEQDHEFAQRLGAFVAAQLRVADAFSENPRANVTQLRSWDGSPAFVSTIDFRAGDALRPWFVDDVAPLISRGLVGWPQVYRGFIERVGIRARGFLESAAELFDVAPIRHLVVIGVPQVVDALAASPHLRRIRSLSLPLYSPEDELTDDMVRRLVASPHLGNLVHLRLVHQRRLTVRAYEDIVTAPTLPQLSSFEVYRLPHRWEPNDPGIYDPRSRTGRMIGFDSPMPVMRSTAWISAVETAFGYEPCLHPEEHYGQEFADIEAIAAHPIALDGPIMARRGESVPARSTPGEER